MRQLYEVVKIELRSIQKYKHASIGIKNMKQELLLRNDDNGNIEGHSI